MYFLTDKIKTNSLVGSIRIENSKKIENFEVYWENQLVAKVEIDFKNQKVICQQYTRNFIARPFWKDDLDVTLEDVMEFLKDRCFPRDRFNRKELLREMGLRHYNVLSILKITHGLMYDDFLWIKFKGDRFNYEHIKIRYDSSKPVR